MEQFHHQMPLHIAESWKTIALSHLNRSGIPQISIRLHKIDHQAPQAAKKTKKADPKLEMDLPLILSEAALRPSALPSPLIYLPS